MKLLPMDEFRIVAERWGMRWEHGRFAFGPDKLESPWWWPLLEGDALTRPRILAQFIVDALESAAIGQAGGFFVCPFNGDWNWNDEHFFRVRNAIVSSVGIPKGFEGAAYFGDDEIDRLAALVFARCFVIDDCVGDSDEDTWVYPAHGQVCLYFSHHEETRVFAATEEPLNRFDDEIIQRGWGWLREPDSSE